MMEIYIGTYEGCIFSFVGQPHQLSLVKHIQPSENSIKSILIADHQLIAGGFSQEFHVYELPTLKQTVDARQNAGQITKIAGVDRKIVGVGSDDGTIRFWDQKQWAMLKEVRVHKKPITDIQTVGKVMFSVGGKKLVLWSTLEMRKKQQYKLQYEANSVLVSEDLTHLIISTEAELKQISTEDNSETTLVIMPTGHKIQAILKVGQFILVGTSKGEIKGWKHGSYSHTVTFKLHENRIKQLKHVQLQKSYLVTCTANGYLDVWELETFTREIESATEDKLVEGMQAVYATHIDYRVICMDCRGIAGEVEPEPQEKVTQVKKHKGIQKKRKK